MADLAESLLALPAFQLRLKALTLHHVRGQYDTLKACAEIPPPPNVSYMLTCASILARSDRGECQDAALRIALYAVGTPDAPEHQRLAAAVVLDVLTNAPALGLAVSRDLLPAHFEQKLPLPLRYDAIARGIQYSILESPTANRLLRLNRFQRDVLVAAEKVDWLSVSAPTSAGKSFIFLKLLIRLLREMDACQIAYVVPTRALIQQVELDTRQELKNANLDSVFVSSVPKVPDPLPVRSLFVVTQERLHWLLMDKRFKPDVLVIDEAQKIGDGARGVLLQEVIEEVAHRNSEVRVYCSSPLTTNPEALLDFAPPTVSRAPVPSEYVAVNQNLLWVSQAPRNPQRWTMDLCLAGDIVRLGEFELVAKPNTVSKRLPLVTFSLGGKAGGNLLYVNGPAEAEKAALILTDLVKLSGTQVSSDKDIGDLVELVRSGVHANYALVVTLPYGVAFHYGNMPLLIKIEIERLFKEGKIRYLACTSTLIEGVNLPAKSIFVRAPQKGRGNPLSDMDFWNLAGRAGRQGKEFQGNVVCVDVANDSVWKGRQPRERRRYPITRSVDDVLRHKWERFINYIAKDTPTDFGDDPAEQLELEHAFVYVLADYAPERTFDELVQRSLSDAQAAELTAQCERVLSNLTLPHELLFRNVGVSPISQERLYKALTQNPKELRLRIPEAPWSFGAVNSYKAVIDLISTYLSNEPLVLSYPHAFLVVHWMQGYSLARLIREAWRYWSTRGRKLADVIRSTMKDVEEYARFKFPKYVSCYCDLLRYAALAHGQLETAREVPELNIWLEFGASASTQIALMGLGLSRTSAIALGEIIADTEMSATQVRKWLEEAPVDAMNLNPIIVAEIKRLLGR